MTLDMEKLTAYVLGELDDAEREAVEELLTGDEAAQEAVAELKATVFLAREAFASADAPALSPESRARIEANASAVPVGRSVWRRSSFRRWVAIGVAAGFVVFVLGSANVLLRSRPLPSFVAMRTDERQATLGKRVVTQESRSEAKEEAPALMLKRRAVPVEHQLRHEANEDRFTVRNGAEQMKSLPEGADAPRQNLNYSTDSSAEVHQSYKPAKDMWGKTEAKKEAESEELHELQNVTAGASLEVRDGYYSQSSKEAKRESAGLDKDGDGLGGRPELSLGTPWLFGERAEPPAAPALNDPNKVYWPGHNTEAYDKINDNPFKDVTQEPLSTFSIDVDTASYSNVRRFLTQGSMPPPDSVRIEELLNYFDYEYAPPADKTTPFASHIEVAACPWAPEHRLARVALKGWEMAANERPASNLVFLIDVSGSMQPENKLPLLKEALRMLVRQLDERDRIAMVVYAGSSGLVLPSTPGNEQEKILDAIGQLESGGSTHGSAGIQLAYETAVQSFLPGGTNRVLLCTDGDFNVGVTDQGQLVRIIEEKAKSGVFLTVLGFGMGNLKDATLEQLADKGNGNYAYIDTLNEARKVLVQGLSGTLVTIAKDVKIQIEFNPAKVKAYRLIGYENRIMAKEDFNDDTKDAGEIGAGHSVTALYELVPPGAATPGAPNVDPLKYQQPKAEAPSDQYLPKSDELFTLKLRYKAPDGDTSKLLEYPARDTGETLDAASPDFRFASAVAEFGMILRGSPNQGHSTYDGVLNLAEGALGKDPYGYRTEFMQLVQKAKALAPQPVSE